MEQWPHDEVYLTVFDPTLPSPAAGEGRVGSSGGAGPVEDARTARGNCR